ncbi:MAG: sulfatase-like hydrolase/transferase [Candidatus Hydrogenedentes bacterium]|nr:sulfatase-like hydrolase/transferase [Candidatus Hydrogenedentota bacterium]
MATDRPNIVLLMTDQQRYDSLGCYGAGFAHTPNLDRLARDGAVFERCYVNNPICTPSRASMMTGKHLPGHGVYRLYDNLPHGEVLFTERLQHAGYTTALFGKLHVSSIEEESYRRHPHDGFDVFEPCLEGSAHMDAPCQAYARWLEERDPEFYTRLKAEGRKLLHPPRNRHMTYWAAERTIDFLRSRHDEPEPFFCMMSIFEPHNPYEHYPPEMGALVDADAIPAPLPRPSDRTWEPPDIDRERHHNHLGDIDTFTPEALRKIRHGYHSAVAYSDLEFGRVLDVLEETGLAENTLVIFTSDHGDMLGDRGLLVKGAHFYDANVRVPLLLRWPGHIPQGARVNALAQLHDIAATVLGAAGVEPEGMPAARNLLDAATGTVGQLHDHAICCYRNSGMSLEREYWDPPINATMIHEGRYKLNLWHTSADPAEMPGELYDMEEDPHEMKNRIGDSTFESIRSRLTDRLIKWLAENERRPGSRGGETRP